MIIYYGYSHKNALTSFKLYFLVQDGASWECVNVQEGISAAGGSKALCVLSLKGKSGVSDILYRSQSLRVADVCSF